jgi:hypothetical protein
MPQLTFLGTLLHLLSLLIRGLYFGIYTGLEVLILTPLVCWYLRPSRHGRGVVLRTCKEWFLGGATDIEYQPLPGPTWIRLLKLEAASSSAVIRCSLRHVDLGSEPDYTALSYTWNQDTTWFRAAYCLIKNAIKDYRQGRDVKVKPAQDTSELKRSKVIVCNGRVTKIHSNMYHALVQLRQRSAREYWVDAICINQRYRHIWRKYTRRICSLIRSAISPNELLKSS